jgi:hypothetical protein
VTPSDVSALRTLNAMHAFDPVPLRGYRTSFYLPFEEMTGAKTESKLGTDIANGQRVAVVGPIGCGKSSLIEYVLATRSTDLAPIWISAAHEGEGTLTDPPEFARHLIRQIVGWATETRQMSREEREAHLAASSRVHASRASTRKTTLSLKLALGWLEPGISDEVTETLANPEVERSRGDYVGSLDRLIELIHDDLRRTPVLVIDDTDLWLRFDGEVRERVLNAFFLDTARMLAERNWAIVFGVHPEYCALAAFRTASQNGWLSTEVSVPELTSPDSIAALLDLRVRTCLDAATEAEMLEEGVPPELFADVAALGADDVFESGYEDVLFAAYRQADANLRIVLTVAQHALQDTFALGEARVSAAALREASLRLAL